MRIVAHLGMPKTGTTTIQHMLRAQSLALAGRVAVAAYDPACAHVRRFGQRFVQSGDSEAERDFRTALTDLRLRLERQGAPVAILSDENLYCREIYTENGDSFGWTVKGLTAILEAFDGHQVVAVYYVRRPDDWTRSAWRQMVKRARCVDDLPAWRGKLPFEPDWTARFGEVAARVGAKIEVVQMEAEVATGRLGEALLRLSGLDDDDLAGVSWAPPQNSALPSGAIEFMRAVNASALPYQVVLRISEIVDGARHAFVERQANEQPRCDESVEKWSN